MLARVMAATSSSTQAIILLGALIVVVVIAGLVIMKVRSSMLSKGSESDEGIFAGLRAMRDAGELSLEEYDAARKRLAAKAAGRPPPPVPARTAATGALRARPGFDLTGAPLPRPGQPPNPPV
jgi:hypothetical protein